MTVHVCPNCDHEVKLPHDCPSEKPMTDTRKPYDPAWKHGFETRNGRAVRLIGATRTGNLVWEHGTEIFQTDASGSRGSPNAFRDIFCTPAPVERPLECWVNIYSDGDWSMFGSHEDAARSGGYGRPGERIAVHMREVTSEPDGAALEFGLHPDLGQSEGGALGDEPDYRIDRGCGPPPEPMVLGAERMGETPSGPAAKEPGGLSAEQVTRLLDIFTQWRQIKPGECWGRAALLLSAERNRQS